MKGLTEAIAAIRANREESLPRTAIAYALVSGRNVGGVPERETRFEAKGNGEATLFRRRPSADTPALPPGLSRGKVDPESLLRFLELLDRSGIDTFRGEAPGPRDLLRKLQVVADGRLFSFRWGPMPPNAPPAISEMLAVLTGWEATACPKPTWRLSLKAESASAASGTLKARIRIENAGPEAIYLAHPQGLAERGLIALGLRYGAKPIPVPGVTPLPISIKTSRMEPAAGEGLRLVPVSASSPLSLDVEMPLEELGEGRPVGMFALEHYLDSDTLAGLPVFNGAIFSEEFTW
jgi:hypothetical protein